MTPIQWKKGIQKNKIR